MFKKQEYIHFSELIDKFITLENLNRSIDEQKLATLPGIKNEFLHEFISTNNIEGDIVKLSTAKEFVKENFNKTDELANRWIGIKYAHNIIWSDMYELNLEYINEVHRSLMRNSPIAGGIWKTKINQVGSLITAHPEDVPSKISTALLAYLSSKMTDGASVFNIVPFISEFLAIHPYEDGNGRMSRLIMNKELYNAGYKFVKYVSVSKFLWENKDSYIDALEKRNNAWASGTIQPNDLVPLFNVILDSLINAARKAHEYINKKKYTKDEVKKVVLNFMHKPITFKKVSSHLNAANSESSIKKWLKELVDEGIIELKGSYKNSKYVISKYKEQK